MVTVTTAGLIVLAGTGNRPNPKDFLSAVDEVLSFSGVQGARTVTERVEEASGGRRLVRIRVLRGQGRRDWLYDVMVEPSGLLGIYKAT